VCREIAGEAMPQGAVGHHAGNAAGAALVVERHDHPVYAVVYLAVGGGVVGHDHRLAQYLGLAHGHAFALEAAGLHIEVACLDVGVGVAFLAEQDHVLLHAGPVDVSPYQLLIAAKPYDIPAQVVDAMIGHYAPGNVGHIVVVLGVGESPYR